MTDKIITIIVLVAASLVIFLLEILTPTFGILAILGIIAIVSAIVTAFSVSAVLGIAMTAGALVLIPAYMIMLVRLLPKTPLGRHMFLGPRAQATAEGTPLAQELFGLIGKTGQADTMLRPTGAIHIEGKRYFARSDSGIIIKGAEVKVIDADGTNVIVRAIPTAAPEQDPRQPEST